MIVVPSITKPALACRRHGPRITATGIQYRLWSLSGKSVSALVNTSVGSKPRNVPMHDEGDGWFCGLDQAGNIGDQYQFCFDGTITLPDVASRFQPAGVHGPSQVMDASGFSWRATKWKRPSAERLVIYELHVGTFSQSGTYTGVIDNLDHLAELGVNAIQLMPLGEFPGRRNWGYDVVLTFAPASAYGSPDELRQLIDGAHLRGLAVIIDVVYNHVCGEPNYLKRTCQDYFKKDGSNPWGSLLNFDGEHSEAVRAFFIENVEYWLDDFRIDGFRLDATHAIEDHSEKHILQEISETVHGRGGFVIAEDDRNDTRLLHSTGQNGFGMDAVWADDFHHALKMTVHPEFIGHFRSYKGGAEEMKETVENGWLFRGQHFPQWSRSRGTECREQDVAKFIYCISNHDQTGNRPRGERLNHLISPEAYRAASMLFLLLPYSPMLFMGQEWGCETPFVFFTNHESAFGVAVSKGRLKEFGVCGAHWPPEMVAVMPDPEGEDSFLKSKLNWSELKNSPHRSILQLYRECLALRNVDSVLARRQRKHWRVWNENQALFMHYGDQGQSERLVVANLTGGKVALPNLAPGWDLLLSSNESRFGGSGPGFSRDQGCASLATTATVVLTRNP